jgi:hypothetical protein
MYRYTVAIYICCVLTSCFNIKKLSNKISINREYSGWYIGTSNAQFFVVNRKGFLKRNIAFMLPEYPANCRPVGIFDSFFVHLTAKEVYGRKYLIIGKNDSTSFEQMALICKAKAFCNRVDTGYLRNAIGEKQKLLYKIKASDGFYVVKAVWLDNFTKFQNLILFSNYNNDSARYRSCDKMSDSTKITRRRAQ